LLIVPERRHFPHFPRFARLTASISSAAPDVLIRTASGAGSHGWLALRIAARILDRDAQSSLAQERSMVKQKPLVRQYAAA
jgi:hypothetical protein